MGGMYWNDSSRLFDSGETDDVLAIGGLKWTDRSNQGAHRLARGGSPREVKESVVPS